MACVSDALLEEEAAAKFAEVQTFLSTAPSPAQNGYSDINDVQALSCTLDAAARVSALRRAVLNGDDLDVSSWVMRPSGDARMDAQSEELQKAYRANTHTTSKQILKVGEKVIIIKKTRSSENGERGFVKSVKWMKRKDSSMYISCIVVGTRPGRDILVGREEADIIEQCSDGTLKEHKVMYFPVIPAKCITVARAQGMEILRGPYHIALDYVYQAGMITVAVSRSDCLPSIDVGNKQITMDTPFANPEAVKFDEFCEAETLKLLARMSDA